jgi:hypothetical protein
MPKVVRLNSEGGSLRGKVMLGELFRTRGFATEVGSSKLNSDVSISGSKKVYTKTPRSSNSACAMAFLGGVERTLDPASSLAFSCSFKPQCERRRPPRAHDLYFMEIGIDARLMALLIEAGPNVMRGIRSGEARSLRVTTGDLPTQCSACP